MIFLNRYWQFKPMLKKLIIQLLLEIERHILILSVNFSRGVSSRQIIGEAVNNLSDEIKLRYTEVKWQDIKDFRNILIHEYFGVDLPAL